jgi:hypothetical protein
MKRELSGKHAHVEICKHHKDRPIQAMSFPFLHLQDLSPAGGRKHCPPAWWLVIQEEPCQEESRKHTQVWPDHTQILEDNKAPQPGTHDA